MPIRISYILFSLVFVTACSTAQESPPPDLQNNTTQVTVNLNPDIQFQTIDHFGASDAWSCQFVGQWTDAKKNAIADLLFSMDTTQDGQPEGIGLSLWRFNIGAGSAEQGANSGIQDEWRRAESFLQSDGSYQWEKQLGQQWFLEAAKQRGVNQFLAFPNSPPVSLTKNGKAYSSDGLSNLHQNQYPEYATYLATVVRGLENKLSMNFQYLSPVNEPQWDWSDGGQEGTPFTNEEIAELVRAIDARMIEDNLEASIDIAEAGQINYLYEDADKPDRGSQINAFYQPGSDQYIGDLEKVHGVISGHSYFTTSPRTQAASMRQQVAQTFTALPDIKYWMTEYCILGDNNGEIDGNGRDLGMNAALYMAEVIHQDLTFAQASAWHWWLAISPYDYKDGLIYIDKQKEDGAYYDSKMLWTLGNFSRFVRPGAIRIESAIEAIDLPSLLVSSYYHENDQTMSTILINKSADTLSMTLKNKNLETVIGNMYVTNEEGDLQPQKIPASGQPVFLPPKSVTTIISR